MVAMTEAPYGSWASPIAASRLAAAAVRLGDLAAYDGKPYWVESRPAEGGRLVVATLEGDGVRILTPETFSARSAVHEYGGAPFARAGDRLYFTNWSDQRLYVQFPDGSTEVVTDPGRRHADFAVDAVRRRLIAVTEDHTQEGEVRNVLSAVPLEGGHARVLYRGADFVAAPALSPDGRQLAWISWSHPDMPWDATLLQVAHISTHGGLERLQIIAGGPTESVLEPRWDADGALYFLSDRSGWWNLYRWRDGKVAPVWPVDAECARPLWSLGQSNYALTGHGQAVIRAGSFNVDQLYVLDLATGAARDLELPYLSVRAVALLDPDTVAIIAASPSETPVVARIALESGQVRVLRRSSEADLDPALIAWPEAIEFPSAGGRTAHAFFYPPTNPASRAPAGERPPLLVQVHGGPTGAAEPALSLKIQYWTSRGFAVVDVNYGGSAGYGRAYRTRLDGQWGVVDVEDVVAAARYLAQQGKVDPARLAISGGSAGGFTVLSALAFHELFRAGASHYGVSDLEALARDTHKFESRYLDRLVAPWPAGAQLYRERSPIHRLDGFTAPLLVLQGLEDKIVPPSQSAAFVAALAARGIPVAHLEFAGEQHGWRRAETIVAAQEAELGFYGRVFGFQPADSVPDLAIRNLR